MTQKEIKDIEISYNLFDRFLMWITKGKWIIFTVPILKDKLKE